MVAFLIPLAASRRQFFSIFTVGTSRASGGKSHDVVGVPLYDWVSLEFLTPRLAHAEPSTISHLRFRFSYPGAHSYGDVCSRVSAPVKLWLPEFTCRSPVLGAAICFVSSLLLRIWEELLALTLVELLTGENEVATSTCWNENQCYFFKVILKQSKNYWRLKYK